MPQSNSLQSLPKSALLQVFASLGAKSAARLGATSKNLHDVSRANAPARLRRGIDAVEKARRAVRDDMTRVILAKIKSHLRAYATAVTQRSSSHYREWYLPPTRIRGAGMLIMSSLVEDTDNWFIDIRMWDSSASRLFCAGEVNIAPTRGRSPKVSLGRVMNSNGRAEKGTCGAFAQALRRAVTAV